MYAIFDFRFSIFDRFAAIVCELPTTAEIANRKSKI